MNSAEEILYGDTGPRLHDPIIYPRELQIGDVHSIEGFHYQTLHPSDPGYDPYSKPFNGYQVNTVFKYNVITDIGLFVTFDVSTTSSTGTQFRLDRRTINFDPIVISDNEMRNLDDADWAEGLFIPRLKEQEQFALVLAIIEDYKELLDLELIPKPDECDHVEGLFAQLGVS